MWRYLIVGLPLILSVVTIKVPVDNKEENVAEPLPTDATAESSAEPTYYTSDNVNVDSYLIPPDPHQPHEVLPDSIITPATYLLPPSTEPQATYYYHPTEPGAQSDWYPINQGATQIPQKVSSVLPPLQHEDIPFIPILLPKPNKTPRNKEKLRGVRVGRVKEVERYHPNKPSLKLEPPAVSAPDDYIIPTPSAELELPQEEIDYPDPTTFKRPYKDDDKRPLANQRYAPIVPTLALHLTPPKITKQKIPTKLYPKKFPGDFRPVPIPISQFNDGSAEIPKAKPVKYFNPLPNSDVDYIPHPEDKRIYLYKQAEEKRKAQEAINVPQQQSEVGGALQIYPEPTQSEQEASETNYRHPGRNAYPVPLRQAPPSAPIREASQKAPPAPDDRTEFRMHGMKGPHSYQFGYDTGKGKNRQFRYEERDNDGIIKGHYGYMDKHGKLRVVNYSAHPELGFHAEAPVDKE